MTLTWEGWLSVGVVALVFVLLMVTSLAPDVILVGGVVVLLVTGVLEPSHALAGLANEGMVTVGVLFIVGAGVRETGGIDYLVLRLLGRPRSAIGAVSRLMFPTMALSAVMNNTPLVAMLIPVVSDWSKKIGVPASKLMIPLSYAAILGGTCTLIGTSTNLVVNGLWIDSGQPPLHMFTITWVGLPAALAGALFVALTAAWLLPDRRPASSLLADPRQYSVEMLVADDSPLVGKSIEQAGLRHLPELFLAEIDRDGMVLPAVSPDEKLRGGDRLVFVGVVDSVIDLQRIRGLVPATDQVFKLVAPRAERCLIEAVVSDTCPVVGKTIRDGRFRSSYNAVVIAVARNGERLVKKIGDIVLRAGDTLLLEAHPSFVTQQRNRRDFYLVSPIEGTAPPRHEKSLVALIILVGMIAAAGTGWVSMLQAAMVAAAAMLITRCISLESARRSVAGDILLAIAAAFALSQALERTGAAAQLANFMISLAAGNPWGTLAVIYLVTLVATELITNNAAAALMFPLAYAAAQDLDVSPLPFVIAVMMAASAGFATPIGYQTNLMVYGPGGYRFSDYVRLGVPLDLLIGAVTVILAPLVYPF